MTPPPPTVLPPLTLPALLDYVLTTPSPPSAAAPTTLVICARRDVFLHDLQLQHQAVPDTKLQALVSPTLFRLAAIQHVTLAFCPSVPSLRAYLTAHGQPRLDAAGAAQSRPRLFLVNPLALHAPTASFSVQGLSRTFATAVEAALVTGAVLTMVECQSTQSRGADVGTQENAGAIPDQNIGAGAEADPWDQDVSMLNVSARRYGSGSERAWAGRTVTARRVAATWFRFCSVNEGRTEDSTV